MKMEIKSSDFDTEFGFAWIVVDGKNEGDEWTVQCCLTSENESESNTLIKHNEEIDCDDCGHNDGICGDVNEKAFSYWGENRCMTALFDAAKKAGIVTRGF